MKGSEESGRATDESVHAAYSTSVHAVVRRICATGARFDLNAVVRARFAAAHRRHEVGRRPGLGGLAAGAGLEGLTDDS